VKFSIITPNLNYAEYLQQAIRSVESQEQQDFEHIIVDGKSTDSSHEFLNVELKLNRNLIWVNDIDTGQSDALNIGISHITGDWFGWLNSDELYLENAFIKVQEYVSANPEIDVIFGDIIHVDSAGEQIDYVAQHPSSKMVIRHYGPHIQSCSMFVRRETLEMLKPDYFNTNLRLIMDWDFLLRLANSGAKFGFMKEPLGYFRVHSSQVTHQVDPAERKKELEIIRFLLEDNRLGAFFLVGKFVHGFFKIFSGGYLRELKWRFNITKFKTYWFYSANEI
jgi:glycosyltransferase involved in cell wall biosynthesis